ncbi:MAG: hypothetical protein Q4C61_08040 [Lachnospiraceae bacterium]|nr:hypothetical protein [Lachnospiraceae bacterium]
MGISVAFKWLSAVFAGQGMYRFPVDLFPMGVPPCQTAGIGTEYALTLMRRLLQFLSAHFAQVIFSRIALFRNRMPAAIGFYGIYRKPGQGRNFLIAIAFSVQLVDLGYFFSRHIVPLFREDGVLSKYSHEEVRI